MSGVDVVGSQVRSRRNEHALGSGVPPIPPRRHFPGAGDAWPLAIASLVVILQMVASGLLKFGYGYFIDEFYYIACSKHLALGYVDHPPFSIWLLALSRALIGDSLPALRLPSALAIAATVFMTARMARALGCGRHGQVLAAVAVLAAPVYLVFGASYSMNPFELLIWTSVASLTIGILRDEGRRRWLAVGLLVGIGLEFKHTMFLYVIALLVGLILSPSRRVLRSRYLPLAGLIALGILLPNLIWQAQHGFPSLEFYRNAILYKNAPKSPIQVVLEQVLFTNPLALPLTIAGLWYGFARGDGRRYRAFGWAYAFLILFMIASRSSRPDRIIAAYPILFAMGARAVERFAAGGWRTRVARAVLPAIALGGIILAPVCVPILPPAALVRYMTAMGFRFEIERGKTAKLPQWLADRFGWEGRVAEVARVWRTLSPEERRHAAIFGGSYGQAGSIEFYAPRYGMRDARVISTHNNYYLWGPGSDSIQVLVGVLVSREGLERRFEDVRQAGLYECPYCMDYQSRVAIYVARRPKTDLRAEWPELKHFE